MEKAHKADALKTQPSDGEALLASQPSTWNLKEASEQDSKVEDSEEMNEQERLDLAYDSLVRLAGGMGKC